MRFGVLGALTVHAAGEPVTITRTKVRALLADLLAHDGRPVSVDRLVDDLWGADPPRDPVAVLQVRVAQLRRALADAEPGGRGLVVSTPAGYLLRAESTDAAEFTELVRRADTAADLRTKVDLLNQALALWRGPAYADFADEPFVGPTVTRLTEQRLTAMEDRAQARLDLGEYDLGELAELVEEHPLRERLVAIRLRALYRAGRQAEALDGYRRLRDHLSAELGLEPGPELVTLHRSILRQDPSLIPEPVSNLPAETTELIGRPAAVMDIGTLLDTTRLVTLTGSGGVGKTRLALAAARARPGDTWLVELAALSTEDDLAEAVLAELGIREDAGAPIPPADRLVKALRDKRLVLVLDNCEHVVAGAAALVSRLLRDVPGVRVLATSQEPLGLPGETRYPVPPLAVPEPGADTAAVAATAAVRLFVARVTARDPGFALTDENAAAVAELCRRLDGIPLALELAAARVPVLGLAELVARLDDRFRLLTGGYRDAPDRQRTLRAVLDWSWGLLPEPERVLLRRLAVHVDGCSLAAAEAVAGLDVGVDFVEPLAALVDRSLVVVTHDQDGPRYRLLESVARYGLDRLAESGEEREIRGRHQDWYLDLAERARPLLYGPGQRRWLAALDRDAANLRAALAGMVDAGRADPALRLANALTGYWFLRGRRREARRELAAALELGGTRETRAQAEVWLLGLRLLDGVERPDLGRVAAALRAYEEAGDLVPRAGNQAHNSPAQRVPGRQDGVADPPKYNPVRETDRRLASRNLDPPTYAPHFRRGTLAVLSRGRWFLGYALFVAGELAASEELIDRALAGFAEVGDTWGTAVGLAARADQALLRGDLATVASAGERSAALLRELGDRWGQVQVVSPLASLAEITGDYEKATRLHRDGLALAEELGLWTDVAERLTGLGRLRLLVGDYRAAWDLHERAMTLAAEQSFEPGVVHAELGLGLIARREGKLDLAETHLRSVLEWHLRADFVPGNALILCELGFVAEQRGDAAAALALHTEALAAAEQTGDPRAVALAWEGLAGAHAIAGDHAEAARLLDAAADARTAADAPLPAGERTDVDRIRALIVS